MESKTPFHVTKISLLHNVTFHRASSHATPFKHPSNTLKNMDTLDKINIAYTAPYAVCNIVSPRAAWEPIMPEMVKSDQSCKLLRLCGTLNAATLAASWAVKDADAETKRKMDLVTGGTYLGLGACMTQFDADTDFGEKFGKPMKFVNIASQLTIGGLFIKRAMDAKK